MYKWNVVSTWDEFITTQHVFTFLVRNWEGSVTSGFLRAPGTSSCAVVMQQPLCLAQTQSRATATLHMDSHRFAATLRRSFTLGKQPSSQASVIFRTHGASLLPGRSASRSFTLRTAKTESTQKLGRYDTCRCFFVLEQTRFAVEATVF